MEVVTLILPKNRTTINEKYSRLLADIVADMLSEEELEYLISQMDKKEAEKENQQQ